MFFKPTMHEDESPGSVFLRLSGAQALKPTIFIKEEIGPDFNYPSILRRFNLPDTPDFSGCVDSSRWNPPKLYDKLRSQKHHKRLIGYRKAKVCPDCANEGKLPLYHDLNDVTACAEHNLKLLTHCQHCKVQLTWIRPGLNLCTCFQKLNDRVPASSSELASAKLLKDALHSNDEDKLKAFIALRAIFSERYGILEPDNDIIHGFLDGKLAPLVGMLSRLIPLPTRFAIRAVLAPLQNTNIPAITAYLPSIEDSLAELKPSHGILPPEYRVTRQELAYTLGTTLTVTSEIMDGALYEFRTSKNNRTCEITSEGISKALQALTQTSNEKGVALKRLITRKKKSSSAWLNKIISGELEITKVGSSWIDTEVAVEASAEDAITGYLTLRQAADATDTYREAIRSLIKVGMLDAIHDKRNNNRHLVSQESLDAFFERYVSAAELAKSVGANARHFACKLIAAGLEPVSGPTIDDNITYIFNRKDITTAVLHKALSIKGAPGVGRKRGDADQVDYSVWATTEDIQTHTGLSAQQVSYLPLEAPLVRGNPANRPSGRRHYYTWDSVRELKQYLDNHIAVQDLAKKVDMTKFTALRRARHLFSGSFMMIGSTHYLPKDKAEAFLSHCRNYWSADTAAKYLGCHPYNIHNWKRLGHLKAIPKDDAGYIDGLALFSSKDAKAMQPFADKL